MTTITRELPSTTTTSPSPLPQPRTICVLSGQQLIRRLATVEHDREIRAIQPQNGGFTVHTDWPGDDSPGTFAIGSTDDDVAAFENIDAGPVNDVAFPIERLHGKTFTLHCQRGPEHPTSRFAVKAMPITWLSERPLQPDATAIVTRDINYRYQEGTDPARIDWQEATLEAGVQQTTLNLQLGTDYEIWVRLQHPDGSERWRIQDPIVITDTGGGGQGDK